MSEWTVYPAIDLRHGRVVRLAQGDPHRETRYSDDALAVARRWQEDGSIWVHVVNLDGAFDEHGGENQAALEGILTTGLQVQLGGGMRSLRDVLRAFDLGVSRVVIGTAAVEDPAMFEAALAEFGPDRIVLGIDARAGRVRTHGWQQESTISAIELACHWAARGVQRVIFTDILRDGMGSGVNLAAARELAEAAGVHVIVSGGVASLDDIRRARAAGLSGIIIGRALYEGKVDLKEALRIGERRPC